MIEVHLKDDSKEEFEKAMRIFKKKCNNDGFMRELRDRRYFRKPSDVKREKINKIERDRKRNKYD